MRRPRWEEQIMRRRDGCQSTQPTFLRKAAAAGYPHVTRPYRGTAAAEQSTTRTTPRYDLVSHIRCNGATFKARSERGVWDGYHRVSKHLHTSGAS